MGKTLSPATSATALASKWNLQMEWELIPLLFGFLFLRFSCAEDRDSVLNGGPWIVDDATLTLEPWSPTFIPSPSALPRTVLWMRIPNLPSLCWNEPCIRLIVAAAGEFVKLDDSTSLGTKGCFARVAIRVDTSKPLVPGTNVELEGFDLLVYWQQFQYEHIHLICSKCGRLGHRTSICPSTAQVHSTPTSAPTIDVNMLDSSSPPADDENPVLVPWIHRRWRGPPRQPSSSDNPSGRSRARDHPRAPARDRSRATRDPHLHQSAKGRGFLQPAHGFGTPVSPPGGEAVHAVDSLIPQQPAVSSMDCGPGVEVKNCFGPGFFGPLAALQSNADGLESSVNPNVLMDFQLDPSSSSGLGNSEAHLNADLNPSPSTSFPNLVFSERQFPKLQIPPPKSLPPTTSGGKHGKKKSNKKKPSPYYTSKSTSSLLSVCEEPVINSTGKTIADADSAMLEDDDSHAEGHVHKGKQVAVEEVVDALGDDSLVDDSLLTDLVDQDRAAKLCKLKTVAKLREPMPTMSQDKLLEIANACGFRFPSSSQISGDDQQNFSSAEIEMLDDYVKSHPNPDGRRRSIYRNGKIYQIP